MTTPTDDPARAVHPPRRPGWVIPLVVGMAVLVLAAGGVATWALRRQSGPSAPSAAATSAPATLVVKGTMQIDSVSPKWELGADCHSDVGHEDILVGAQVTVTDPAGTVLAIGKLDVGKVADHPTIEGAKTCIFAFSVPGVPAGKNIYGVEVSHRGVVQFPEAELGDIKLTLR